MEDFERELMEHNDDDWFVPDTSIDYISKKEYEIYLMECHEEYLDYLNYG